MKLRLIFSTILSQLLTVPAWNLKKIGQSENYYISSVAVFRTRTFLALPRSVPCNKKASPTIVEVTWKSERRIFPSVNYLNDRYFECNLTIWYINLLNRSFPSRGVTVAFNAGKPTDFNIIVTFNKCTGVSSLLNFKKLSNWTWASNLSAFSV